MPVATIIKYDDERGYGFLQIGRGEPDVFFHIKAVEPNLVPQIAVGLRVAFEYGTTRDGRPCAVDVKAVPVGFGETA
jgi:cold shock CspA family protein